MRAVPANVGPPRMFVVRTSQQSPEPAELAELSAAAASGAALGYNVAFLVDRALPPSVDFGGLPVAHLLDNSETLVAAWMAADPRNIALEANLVLAERLQHFADRQLLTSDDVFVLADASLLELDQVWSYLLATSAERPRVHVHLQTLLPHQCVGSVRSVRHEAVLRLAKSRFDHLGVLAANTLTFSAASEEIAELLEAHGLSTEVAAVDELRPGADVWSVPAESAFVVHLAPSWGGQGASMVFESQLRYIAHRGYASLVLHVSPSDLTPIDDAAARRALAAGLPAFGAAHRWLLVREDPNEPALGLHRPYELPHLSFEGESRVARTMAVPQSLRNALAHRRVSWVLANYAQLVPLVPSLGLEHVPLVTETIDIRPVQHALNNDLPVEPLDLEAERNQWSRSDGVVFINDRERLDFLGYDDHEATVTAFPFADVADRMAAPDPFATDATSLLSSGCATSNPELVLRLIDELELGRDDNEIRCLYVASNHRANVESLNWYLEHVHLPFLQPRGDRLLVAGSIGSAFAGNAVPGVDFLGRVDDLEQLYRLSDVVVLPIVAGTGLPTKMIDAINRDALFVAVSGALNPVPELANELQAYDDPRMFADRVLSLATDAQAAAEFRDQLSLIRSKISSWQRYVQSWDEVTAGAGIAHPITVVPAIDDPWPPEHVEVSWDPAARLTTSVGVFGERGITELGQQVSLTSRYGRFAIDCSSDGELPIEIEMYNPSETDRQLEWFSDGRSIGATLIPKSAVTMVTIDPHISVVDGQQLAIVEILERDMDGVVATEPIAVKQVRRR